MVVLKEKWVSIYETCENSEEYPVKILILKSLNFKYVQNVYPCDA